MNKLRNYIIAFSIALFSCTFCPVQAQDLHFSQWSMNPQYQNPALTGIFEGDFRISGHYRSQWESVPVQYRTMATGFETKLITQKNTMLAGGLLLQHDQAGDGMLSWTHIGININAARALNPQNLLSVGLSGAIVQRSLNLSQLKFNNQWDGDIYNPGLSSKETLNNTTGIQPSIGAGLNWHYARGRQSRTQADAGFGIGHVNRPQINFLDDGDLRLPIRYNIYGQTHIQYTENADYTVFGQIQYMGKASETLIGAGWRYWLNDESAIQLANAIRLGDAYIPAITLTRQQWTFGLSYDINFSPFKVATGRRGGFEIAVQYKAAPVKPIKEMKVCPIF